MVRLRGECDGGEPQDLFQADDAAQAERFARAVAEGLGVPLTTTEKHGKMKRMNAFIEKGR